MVGDRNNKEQKLWDEMTKAVKPLAQKRYHQSPQTLKVKTVLRAHVEAFDLQKEGREDSFYYSFDQGTESDSTSHPSRSLAQGGKQSLLDSGDVTALDRRLAEKFKKGQLTQEARLDLHGLTVERAQKRTEHFISQAYGQGQRFVLIITGKGSPASPSTLRQELPLWLNAHVCRHKILSFCPALPKDGGEGAFYVLLKRDRSR